MIGTWSSAEETLLIENLELGHDIELISEVLGRTPSDVALRMLHLYQEGTVVVMSGATFDAFVNRVDE